MVALEDHFHTRLDESRFSQAGSVAALKELVATPATTPAAENADPRFNVAAIDKAMDRKGTLDGAVYKYTIARTEAVDCASSFLSAGLVSDNSRVARDMGSLDVAHSF